MGAGWGVGDHLDPPTSPHSTRTRTLHDVVPISCLAEFPNVVQMAKVGAPPPSILQQHPWVPPPQPWAPTAPPLPPAAGV